MHHCSFFFNQRGDRTGGWTFNLWNTRDDVTNLKAAITDMGAILQHLTGKGCNVTKCLFSKYPGFREADEVKFTYDTGVDPTDEANNADYQTTAVGLQLKGDPNYKVTQWLSGIADTWVYNAGRLKPEFSSYSHFLELKNALKSGGNGWTLNVLLKTRVKKVVKSISNTGVVACTGHGFDGATDVRISRVKGNKYPNQIWRVENIDANSFQLIGFNDPFPGGYDCRKAIARPQTFGPIAITNLIARRASSHRRGKPTDLLSGKSKKKA